MNENKSKPTAVVVNDDTTQLGILSGLARKAGLEPLPFTGAEAALAAMDPETPPDIIVTDLYMPGLDGWRFCRLLRSPEYAFCNEAPILVVSATFAGDNPERIAADIGADIFLPSPVDGKEFVAHVKALLSGKETRRLPRALIVEDGKSLAGLLKKAFAAHGYAADTALSGSEAEAAFGKTAYDVAVIDHHLPDGTGDTLLDAFRARRPDCVCVMMTTETTPELALDWMKRGAAAYLRKPFEPEFLIELCARAQRERTLLRVEDLLDARTQELRASEETHRALVAGLPDIVMRFDREGRHLFVSDNVRETVDMEAAQFIGKTHAELGFPEEQCRFWEDAIRQVFDSGKPSETEFTFEGKAGPVIFNWRLIPERGAQGAVSSVLSISRDITAHRKAEQEYRTLFSKMLDGFALHEIILDTAGTPVDYRFLAVNPAFEHMTGLKAGDIAGRTILEVLPGIERHWIETYGKVALTGEPVQFMNHSADLGKYFEVTAFRPAPGQFACIFQDITARKLAEEEKEKLQSQFLQAQKMESIGMLAGGIAHDFNNLLHVMGGNLQFLDMKIPDDHPGKKRVKTIQKSMDRAAHLVKQMLLFSRKTAIQRQSLDLNREIRDVRNILERSIPKMVNIELILDDNAWSIKADPIQVEQVLLNLGTNAADAMPDGGRLIIETANVTLDQGFVPTTTGAKPGNYVLMTVSDTGCGMDKEALQHVFDPFFTTKEVGKGTGLGLASVYGIVKAHEGHITCYSEPGKGTTFKVYWPAIPENDVHKDESVVRATYEGGSETILVVDDEEEIRELTELVLEDHGYQAFTAASGEQALDVYAREKQSIDLILLDLNMPGMGGHKCLREILNINPEARVIIASGYSANGQAKDIQDSGAARFIGKPFQTHKLLAKIREVLEGE